MSFIKINKISKSYVDGMALKYAVKEMSFNIEKGDFLVLSGPSGSGKTTLLNLISGLDVPDSGGIIILNENLAELNLSLLSDKERDEFRLKNTGFVFQSYNLIPVLSAEENVYFTLQLLGVSKEERKLLAREMLDRVGLKDLYLRRPSQLSGGQQQRVAIARAMVSKPALILADEPTANLDSSTAKQLLDLMVDFNREFKTTFVFSSHDEQVISYAKRVITLKDGILLSDTKKNF